MKKEIAMVKRHVNKLFAVVTLTAFLVNGAAPAFAQSAGKMPWMPEPGTMVETSAAFVPAHLRGLVVNANDPFKFDFIVYKGDEALTRDQKESQYKDLIKYFLASLAIPDNEQWVNLSPYEKDRIIPDNFGLTEMGRDLLAQDYLLKQIAASLTHPDKETGRAFWARVYAEAYQKYGTTEIDPDTFNKVWIVPSKAVVYEKGNTAYVLEHHLKVLTEKDYLARQQSAVSNPKAMTPSEEVSDLSTRVLREVIVPALEKEANEGKNFAPLRQIFSGMLLATWYKKALKLSILGKLYADQSKVQGLDQDPAVNQQIYQKYLKSMKTGAFNMIREDVDQYSQEVIPRKYFSGGLSNNYAQVMEMVTTLMPGQDSAMRQDAVNEEGVTAVLVTQDQVGDSKAEVALKSKNAGEGLQPGEHLRAESWDEILDYAIHERQKGTIGLKRLYVDIDNTLIMPMGRQNSEGQKDYLIGKLAARLGDRQQAERIVYKYYSRVEDRMVRHGFFQTAARLDLEKLDQLRALGVEVIALTARPGDTVMQERVNGLLQAAGVNVSRVIYAGGVGAKKIRALHEDLSKDDVLGKDEVRPEDVVFIDDRPENTAVMAGAGIVAMRVAPVFSNQDEVGYNRYLKLAIQEQAKGRTGFSFEYLLNAYDQALRDDRRAEVMALARQLLAGNDLREFEEWIERLDGFIEANQFAREDFSRPMILAEARTFVNEQEAKLQARVEGMKAGSTAVNADDMRKIERSVKKTGRRISELLRHVEAHESLFKQRNLVFKAIEEVIDKQGGVLRNDFEFYPIHPVQVALDLVTEFGITDPKLVLAALLHDIIEDVPEYRNDPDRLGRIFGRKVQALVQSLTNKELSPEADLFVVDLIRKARPGITEQALEALRKTLVYQVGVALEIRDRDTLLIKSRDFERNALWESALQGRLAGKYSALTGIFVKRFFALTREEESRKVLTRDHQLIRGLVGALKRYEAAIPRVEQAALNWEYGDDLRAVMSAIHDQFGGIDGLADHLAATVPVVPHAENAAQKSELPLESTESMSRKAKATLYRQMGDVFADVTTDLLPTGQIGWSSATGTFDPGSTDLLFVRDHGKLIGFLVYKLGERPEPGKTMRTVETVFHYVVAHRRGEGLGAKLIIELVRRYAGTDVVFTSTGLTDDGKRTWRRVFSAYKTGFITEIVIPAGRFMSADDWISRDDLNGKNDYTSAELDLRITPKEARRLPVIKVYEQPEIDVNFDTAKLGWTPNLARELTFFAEAGQALSSGGMKKMPALSLGKAAEELFAAVSSDQEYVLSQMQNKLKDSERDAYKKEQQVLVVIKQRIHALISKPTRKSLVDVLKCYLNIGDDGVLRMQKGRYLFVHPPLMPNEDTSGLTQQWHRATEFLGRGFEVMIGKTVITVPEYDGHDWVFDATVRKAVSDGRKKGGIDLNGADLEMQIKRDGNGVVLPVSQQNLDNIRINGLVPVILDIHPVVNMSSSRS